MVSVFRDNAIHDDQERERTMDTTPGEHAGGLTMELRSQLHGEDASTLRE
jgi:hypothetical protein